MDKSNVFVIGDTVRYYQGGWRTGYYMGLESVDKAGNKVKIQPIGAKGKAKPKILLLDLNCVETAK